MEQRQRQKKKMKKGGKRTLLASGSRHVCEFWESITGLRPIFGANKTESVGILSPQSCDAEKERLRGTLFLPTKDEREEAERGTLREPIAAIDAIAMCVCVVTCEFLG